jgi:two-component system phosphate regulon sensor histidine kinase PhoR
MPIACLIVSQRHRVVAANQSARAFFGIDHDRLPLSLIEATREARLESVIREHPGGPGTSTEVRLAHRPRVVCVTVVDGPEPGLMTTYIADVTELRRLETVRQEFVANLSHELKTPIASLRLAAETLLGNPPSPVRRRFAQRVVDEGTHLSEIIDNLRELADIESGRTRLSVSTFELEILLKEVAIRHNAVERLEIGNAKLRVQADRGKVAQILDNLVDNALKFSPAGTPVEICAETTIGRNGPEISISVRDRGPGISPEHRDKVFERLYKLDPARSRYLAGSGLGLAIAKHLVLAHGGRIWTENCDDGGQVFAFAIPQPGTASAGQQAEAAAALNQPVTSG